MAACAGPVGARVTGAGRLNPLTLGAEGALAVETVRGDEPVAGTRPVGKVRLVEIALGTDGARPAGRARSAEPSVGEPLPGTAEGRLMVPPWAAPGC